MSSRDDDARSDHDALLAGVKAEPDARPAATAPTEPRRGWPFAWAIVAIALVTGVGLLALPYLTLADITMLYLIAIMVVSLAGRGPSMLAASLAVAALDFFFVPPQFTFAVSDVRHLLTFAVMFASGTAISTLMVRLRRQERDAIDRERRTAALLAFTREVAPANDAAEVAAVATRHLEAGLDVAAALLVPDADGSLVSAAGLMPLAGPDVTVARWAFDHRRAAGHDTDTIPGARAIAIPLVDADHSVGVLVIQRRKLAPVLAADQVQLLEALARQTTLALARVRFAEQAKEAALRARTEELRSSLLSAVSHDLRTPLSVITGAATSLRDDGDRLPAATRAELIATIVDDARRLERVLANLLQLTKVEAGLVPDRDWVPAEEIVGAALTRLETALRTWRVDAEIEPDLQLWIDAVLFEQVLINLIENALKHAAAPLSIRAYGAADIVILEVADRGPGLPLPASRLFEKFVRASSAPGAGLGLAVVQAIVASHGGTVVADNRPDGGAVFRIKIPAGIPPAARPDRGAPGPSSVEVQP